MNEAALANDSGLVVVERSLLDSLYALWGGDFQPKDLIRAERALRAILTGRHLLASRYYNPALTNALEASKGDTHFEMPFGEPVLDYEFVLPDAPHILAALEKDEAKYLEDQIGVAIFTDALKSIPKWVRFEGEANAFIDAWYRGWDEERCNQAARDRLGWELLGDDPYQTKGISYADLVGLSAREHAHYLVASARAGSAVFGDSPVATYCNAHLFTKWPEELFKRSEAEFSEAARQIRSPAMSFSMPPLIQLLLSRATVRHEIPTIIRDLREELHIGREALWGTLRAMWRAPTFKEQMEHLRHLEAASDSLFSGTFPDRIDTLSVGLSAAPLSPSAIAGAARIVRDHNRPQARVSAVGFTKALSLNFRKELKNSEKLFRKFLSHTEQKDFGLK